MRPRRRPRGALIALLVLSPGPLAAADLPLGELVHPPQPRSSLYDQIAAAEAVVLARAEEPDGEGARFTVEEAFKGDPGAGGLHIASPSAGADARYPPGEGAILALVRDGERWKRSPWGGEMYVRDSHDVYGDDWIRLYREYARIAALGDPGERQRALEDLRRRAAAEEDGRGPKPPRYPGTTVADLDEHLHVPSPCRPFADLAGFYEQAAREDERVAALWAIEESGHPEAPAYLRGILASGRDLGGELVPIAYSLAARDDEPGIAALAAALRADSDTFARRAGLEAFVRIAEPRDLDLAWRLAREIDYDRYWEGLVLAPWLAAHTRAADLAARYRRLPAPAKLALIGAAVAHPEVTFLRDLILAGDDPRGRYRGRGAGALARELEAAAGPPRRRAALFLAASSAGGGWLPRWWMLEHARGDEADVLLTWFSLHPPAGGELVALAREARVTGELDRALWTLAVAAPALLVPAVRQIDDDLSAEAPWLPPRRAAGDEWLERSAEAGDGRIRRAILGRWSAAAGAADAPLLLQALTRADREEAEALLPYFLHHPDPGAVPSLRRFYDEPRLARRRLAEALAACGDTAVVYAAFELLAHSWNDADVEWGLAVIALSPLPETGERVLALDRKLRDRMLSRYSSWGNGGDDDASLIQRPVMEALLAGWVPDPQVTHAPVRALLWRLVESGEEWVRPYLDRLGPPESFVVY